MPRLKYEFKHLELSTSVGYNPNYVHYPEVTGGDQVKFTFEENADQEIEKGISSSIKVYGNAAVFIRDWLIDHANASVHTVLVRITDISCNQARGEWLVKSDSLEWLDNDICEYKITLREYDPTLDCMKTTTIADNWRGWFPEDGFIPSNDYISNDPLNTYLHPRYRYCDDVKPQALQNFLFVVAQSILIAFNTMIGPIFAIMSLLNDISNFLGFGNLGAFNDLNTFIDDTYDNMFGALLGCNRVHPAPYVRNYFNNVCTKCNLEFTSSILNDPGSPYWNLTHLFAPVKKGLNKDSTRDWISDNEPIFTGWSYAKSLRRLFNAKYMIRGGKFYFERKDYYDASILFDFTNAATKAKLVEPISFAWTGESKKGYQDFSYAQDAFDQTGNEARHRFNDVTDWNPNYQNPLLSGEDKVTIENYSSQRYTNDGIDQRLIFKKLGSTGTARLDGVLLMSSDMTSVGKLIIHEGSSGNQYAECIRMPYAVYNAITPVNWIDDYVYDNNPVDYYVYNWNMFYDAGSESTWTNLYSFHKIDDPNLATKKNISFTLKMQACCADIQTLMYTGNEMLAKIDYQIRLNASYYGIIKKIFIDYERMEITLQGKIK